MPGAADLYIQARRALLDALEALEQHRNAIVLVGAQAVYLYTGDSDVPIATQTKDSDIVINPRLIEDDPLLEEAMAAANFHRNLESGQPGEWLASDGIPVDLLVPESLVSSVGRRGARIPPHSRLSTRKVRGLEAAVVDSRPMNIASLETGDHRAYLMNIASPAALLVAKSFKLGERLDTPSRLLDKDAHDVYRLVMATETDGLVRGYEKLFSDARSESVAKQSLSYLRAMFETASSIGPVMAGRAEEGVGNPPAVAESVFTIVQDLIAGVETAGN